MKQSRVRDGEIFDAKMSRDLIVDNAVGNRREHADQNDLYFPGHYSRSKRTPSARRIVKMRPRISWA